MKISKRASSVEPSVTLAITAKAKEMKAAGENVINFGAGEPDFDTPSNIKEAAITAINKGFTKYTAAPGINELKDAIIEKFKRDNNIEYKRENVIANVGAKHSIYNFFQAMIDDGDEVIIPAPYWVSYPPQVILAGGKPVIINTKEENSYRVTPDELEKAITPKTRALVINSPSNPTGSLYNKADLEKLAGILKNKDIYIISDDVYEQMIYDNEKFYNLVMVDDDLKEKTLLVNAVSKTYSMTGWRIGYAAGPKNVIAAMSKIQSQSTSNPTSIAQWAAIEAILGPQTSVSEMRTEYQKRRDVAFNMLREIPNVKASFKPQGAFYIFPNFGAHLNKKYPDSVSLCKYILETVKVACVPGSGFGAEGCVRISYATSMENLKEGINRIKEALQKL